jgi:uncharacterized damage-inducible protein DinB
MEADAWVTVATLVLAAATQAPAATAPPAGSAGAELAGAFAVIAGDLRAAAEKMPAELYGFRPADGVRDFGQIIAHVAGGQFLYCSQAANQRLEPAVGKKLNDVRPFSDVETARNARVFEKAELVALLAESTAYCDKIYSNPSTSTGTGVKALVGNIAHANEHYGNLVTYLRMKGLVPPSTERRRSGSK